LQSSQWFTYKMVRRYLHNEGVCQTMKAKHIYTWKHFNVMWNDKSIGVMMDEYHSTFTISTILKIIIMKFLISKTLHVALPKVSKNLIFKFSKFMTHVFICPRAPPNSNPITSTYSKLVPTLNYHNISSQLTNSLI
jgi:hypothetical protein